MGKKKSKKKAPAISLRLSRTSLLLWSLVFLVFLGWIFALGVFIGKGMLPQSVTSTVRAPIESLRGMVQTEEHPKSDLLKREMKGPELTFYRKLSSKKEEAAKRMQAPASKPTGPEKAASGSGETPEASERGETYVVQIASLDSMDSASGLVDRLKAGGFPAYTYKVKLDGKFFYRVRCGTFNTLEAAVEARRRIAQAEGLDGIVIRAENR